jgi:hypothetical protein
MFVTGDGLVPTYVIVAQVDSRVRRSAMAREVCLILWVVNLKLMFYRISKLLTLKYSFLIARLKLIK